MRNASHRRCTHQHYYYDDNHDNHDNNCPAERTQQDDRSPSNSDHLLAVGATKNGGYESDRPGVPPPRCGPSGIPLC